MQLQIECNQVPLQQQSCLICSQLFEMAEARIFICNDRGKYYGEVCPTCLKKGFDWLSDRFKQLNQPTRKVAVQQIRSLEIPLSV